MIILKGEEFCNPNGYADCLNNIHYHHSEKGCNIEMFIKNIGFQSEEKRPVLMKRCLTHNIECHKEGWEIGWYNGNNSNKNTCICGKELEYRKRLCQECRIKNHKLSLLKQEVKRKQESEFIRVRKLLKNNPY